MSAAGRREELEAVIWPRVTPGRQEHGKDASRRAVDAILAAADTYATALAAEEIDRTEGRARLDVADAEYHGRTP